MEGRWENTSGRTEIRYASSAKTCKACPLKARCLSPTASRRTIGRWEHEDVLERHRARMRDASELMRSFGDCRASLWHAQVPRRLSPLPGPRPRQGARRMEPDGALLQLHPRAQYPRIRGLCDQHGKGIPVALARPKRPGRLSQAPCRCVLNKYAGLAPAQTLRPLPCDDQHYLPSLDGQTTSCSGDLLQRYSDAKQGAFRTRANVRGTRRPGH